MPSRQLLSALCLMATPLTLQAAYWSPHVGVDYKYWGVVTAEQYYYEFPRLNNAFDMYVGTRINGYFGLDFGYEQSENKEKTAVFEGGEIVFANPELPNNSTRINLTLRSLYGNMLFYWQVVEDFELIFSMGAAKIYPETTVMHLSTLQGSWLEYENKSEPFWSGRFGFAVQYSPCPLFGIKAALSWDQVRRLNYLGTDENDDFFDVHPYHKATTFSIGFVYSFTDPRRRCCQEYFENPSSRSATRG